MSSSARTLVLYNARQSYTPALDPCEFNERSLIIDTETVGAGPSVEVVELALGDFEGRIVYHSLVRPLYNRLPRATRATEAQRFARDEFADAPEWPEVWAAVAPLLDNRLLIAYNAAFDRRALAAMRVRNRQESNERGWRCAMQLAKARVGAKKNLTLTEACAHYGLEGGTHRADADVLATYRLLKRLTCDDAAA
ncbi:MAG TPA: 3'-5' exonuclease [Pyrinomonadaceae bacterium]|nr:3'-5' exonuclease [Pyrinomonadaceae bacterium]